MMYMHTDLHKNYSKSKPNWELTVHYTNSSKVFFGEDIKIQEHTLTFPGTMKHEELVPLVSFIHMLLTQ